MKLSSEQIILTNDWTEASITVARRAQYMIILSGYREVAVDKVKLITWLQAIGNRMGSYELYFIPTDMRDLKAILIELETLTGAFY